MVVGPHGAGLSNILFSQAGTVIIEMSCALLPKCYMDMAQTLGHPYVGLLSTKKTECGPIYTDVEYLKRVVENILDYKTNETSIVLLN